MTLTVSLVDRSLRSAGLSVRQATSTSWFSTASFSADGSEKYFTKTLDDLASLGPWYVADFSSTAWLPSSYCAIVNGPEPTASPLETSLSAGNTCSSTMEPAEACVTTYWNVVSGLF